MEISLKGKNALITGGSHGIGKKIALELAAAEANVAIVYGHNQKAAKQTFNEIEQTGQQGIAIQADLAKISELQQIFNQAEAQLGKLDIFVSNASVVVNKPLGQYTLDDYDKTFNVNTRAPFFLMQEAA